MLIRCIIKRSFISKLLSRWSTATLQAVSVGHFDGVAQALAWSPSSRPKSLLKTMYRSFATQGYRQCMLGSHGFNGSGLDQIHRWRALKMPQPARMDVMVILKTLGTRWLNLWFFYFVYPGFSPRTFWQDSC